MCLRYSIIICHIISNQSYLYMFYLISIFKGDFHKSHSQLRGEGNWTIGHFKIYKISLIY